MSSYANSDSEEEDIIREPSRLGCPHKAGGQKTVGQAARTGHI